MRDFDGLTGGALWQDLKMGVEHLRGWKKIALVTDTIASANFGSTWMRPSASTRSWPRRRGSCVAARTTRLSHRTRFLLRWQDSNNR